MKVTLKKIEMRPSPQRVITITLNLHFAWNNDMVKETVKINYNIDADEIYYIAKIRKPGIGNASEKVLTALIEISGLIDKPQNKLIAVLEKLQNTFDMDWQHEKIEDIVNNI